MQRDPRRLPPLDRLLVFEAAARHLSFTKAGAECFLTQSAVSRQVAALEEDLGTPLFVRRHRALELTDAGRLLATASATAFATLRDAVGTIRAPARREVVALTTTPGLASLWLIPRLAGFTAAHPGVDVRIDATHDLRALAADQFDLAIRYGRVDAPPGEPLFAETVLPLAAPALLKRGPPLASPSDLKHHTLLQVAMTPSALMPVEWQSWLAAAGTGSIEPAALLTFSHYDAAVAAALDGQGIVLGRRPLVDRLIKARRLVAPFRGETASARGYFLVVEPAAARRPAVQALAEWLRLEARQGR